MESIQPDHDDNSTKTSSFDQFVLPSSPEISGICGDPQVNTRVGDAFQVEAPPMISEAKHLQLLMNPLDSEGTVHVSHHFLMGLPIPIMRVYDRVNGRENKGCRSMSNPDNAVDATGSDKSRKRKKNYIMRNEGSKLNAQPFHAGLDDGKESKPANLGAKIADKVNSDSYSLVPGSPKDAWSEAEVDIFILGLYIFGKNFVQIKRFIDNKEMGELLTFYYGEFYGSDGYRRWSDCRKTTRKKCIYGKKIFTGWRQQELLSRLHPHVPEHFQNTFVEVSMAFTEEKISLEDYVSNLKAVVGIQVLVEAISIGKGKKDLTSVAMEPVKSNPLFSVCPIGKDCSSLTSSDIIKLLTGGFRLSKARCNDIFWEAVWPRLLARGWHSEQPKSGGYLDTKYCLVFLAPGVKKFSRRKLVKGDHYFDSISDVLSKVASEPKLLELEAEEVRGSSCIEEDEGFPEVQSDQDDPPFWKSQCYLKPRVSTCNLKRVKFTVVDSSLVHGGKLSEVREMRYSPDDLNVKSLLTTFSSRTESNFLENSSDENELGAVNMSVNDERNISTADCNECTFDYCRPNHTKVTIVDTSLVSLGKSFKLIELRYLPVKFKATSEMTNSSRKNDGDSSEASPDEHFPDTAANTLSNGENNINKSTCSMGTFDSDGSNQTALNSMTSTKLVESLQDKNNVSDENHSSRNIKHQFSRRAKPSHSNNLVPLMKRRRLTACSDTEISNAIENFPIGLGSKQVVHCALKSPEKGSNAFQISPSQAKLSSTSSSAEGIREVDKYGGIPNANCADLETSLQESVEHQYTSLIDLNPPQVLLESEIGEPSHLEIENSQGVNAKNACLPPNLNKPDLEALRTSVNVNPAAEQPNVNPTRQSTRNRHLTTKALEALECTFLNPKKSKKKAEVGTQEIKFVSPSRRARSKVKVTQSHVSVSGGIVNAKEERVTDEAINTGNIKDFVSKTPDTIEEKQLTSY